nr:MAG TPA: hypothetical protein [Siphoviridae sp. ctEfY6]
MNLLIEMKVNIAFRRKRLISYLIRKINKITDERNYYRNKINQLNLEKS